MIQLLHQTIMETLRRLPLPAARLGFRASMLIQPIEQLKITPRVVYQTIDVDGFNRVDIFNIFANPYTTTRPPVRLGDRSGLALGGQDLPLAEQQQLLFAVERDHHQAARRVEDEGLDHR